MIANSVSPRLREGRCFFCLFSPKAVKNPLPILANSIDLKFVICYDKLAII